ncbi:MAG: metalloprotease [Clostridiales bacterium]|uniref:M50 family metallopeptidase n=1 Tax=Clostridium sp. N3C TaxID=1776758 RepID=UPI00092DFCC8|nr:M50 family metallopeptidase [Clostridium sp. N3C]NLZ48526.1 metalloprotease [Clostridiales bacterium]SCN21739.1 Stage IV sporulation protein FB [Clostridium sp. N3C]
MIKLNKFFIPYIFLLIVIGFRGELLVSFILVILHEIVHYLTAVAFGFSGFDIKILPIGAVLRLKDLDEATPFEDLLISLSGPLFNLLLAAILYYISTIYPGDTISFLIKSNLSLGIFNLIPAFPLDGGRVLRDCLCMKIIYRRANEITVKVSMVLGYCILGAFFISLTLKTPEYNFAIIGVFVIISSYKERERIVYIIMSDIIRKKNRFISTKYMENKNISVYYKGELINLLSIMDKNKYNVFTVLDEDMRVMDVIYEEEIVQGLKTYGNITIEEFIKYRDENT